MPTKLVTYGNSISGTQYQAFINADGQGGSGVPEVPMVALSYSYEQNEKRVDAEIIASTCTLTILLQTPSQRTALNEALTGDEGKNTITVLRNNSVDWIGGIITGISSEEDGPYPQEFTIKATDGVARLKDTNYEFGGIGSNELVVCTEHIRRILNLCPNNNLYNTGQVFIRINTTLVPDLLTPDNSVCIFSKLRISAKALRTVDKSGEVVFSSAYDALKHFLAAFGLRIVYAKGAFNIYEVSNAARVDDSLIWHEYDFDMTSLGAVTLSDWSTESNYILNQLSGPGPMRMLSGGRITPEAPVRRVEYTYKHYSLQNLSSQVTWTDTNTDPDIIENFEAGGGLALRVSGSVRPGVTIPGGAPFPSGPVHVVVSMNLYVEDQDGNIEALTRTYNYAAGSVNYNDSEWIATSQIPPVPILATATAFGSFSTPFSVLSPPVPQGGTLYISFELDPLFPTVLANGESFAANATFEVDNVFVQSVIGGTNEDQYNFTVFGANNAGFEENSILEERELIFGDGPEPNSFGRIQAKTGPGTFDWENTDGWRHYVSNAYLAPSTPHTNLLTRDLLFLKNTAQDRLDTAFIAPNYFAHYVVRRSNKVFLLQRGTLNLLRDEVSGTWTQIAFNQPGTLPNDDTFEFISPPPGATQVFDVEPPIAVDDAAINPPLGGPQLAHNGVIAALETEILAGVPITVLDIDALPSDVALQAGDQLILTHPYTGQTQIVTIATDYNDGVTNPWVTPDGGTWALPGGGTWIVNTTPGLEINSFTPAFDMPVGTYVQFENHYDIGINQLTKIEHEDYDLFRSNESLTVGTHPLFFRPVTRLAYRIEGVSFALFSNAANTTSVIRVIYTNLAGASSTVAEYNSSALTEFVSTTAVMLEGLYTFEVVSMDNTAPLGLVVTFKLRKGLVE